MTVEERGSGEYFGDVMARRMERRDFLKGAGAIGATLVVAPAFAATRADTNAASPQFVGGADPGTRIQFQPIAPAFDDVVEVAENYDVDVVIRWGDPIHPDAEPFDLMQQSASRQEKQFGFNCDFLTSMPLPGFVESAVARSGRPTSFALFLLGFQFANLWRRSSRRMLLWVNHEYTTGVDMFPGYSGSMPTEEQARTEFAAHGGSVVGIVRGDDRSWSFDIDSPFNRRITGTTRIRLGGPLAGNDLVKTSADPDNLDFDDAGNLWIATDGQPNAREFGQNDGVFAVPTEGRDRSFLRQFLSAVPSAEVASLKFTGDQKTLFVSIQHPAEGTGLANPSSTWPDGEFPRPSIAVRHRNGKKIGSL